RRAVPDARAACRLAADTRETRSQRIRNRRPRTQRAGAADVDRVTARIQSSLDLRVLQHLAAAAQRLAKSIDVVVAGDNVRREEQKQFSGLVARARAAEQPSD